VGLDKFYESGEELEEINRIKTILKDQQENKINNKKVEKL